MAEIRLSPGCEAGQLKLYTQWLKTGRWGGCNESWAVTSFNEYCDMKSHRKCRNPWVRVQWKLTLLSFYYSFLSLWLCRFTKMFRIFRMFFVFSGGERYLFFTQTFQNPSESHTSPCIVVVFADKHFIYMADYSWNNKTKWEFFCDVRWKTALKALCVTLSRQSMHPNNLRFYFINYARRLFT